MFGDLLHTSVNEGKEKHVPVIHAPEKVTPGEFFNVTVAVGEEVPHPNSAEHHIKWIQVFAQIQGKPPIHVLTFDVAATVVDPQVTFKMKLDKPADLYALAYCNIHGLWESNVKVDVQ